MRAVTDLLPLFGYPYKGGRLYMSNEQLTWIDPFIYQEWPVLLAHRMTRKKRIFTDQENSKFLKYPFHV